jgi:hypothetical protein
MTRHFGNPGPTCPRIVDKRTGLSRKPDPPEMRIHAPRAVDRRRVIITTMTIAAIIASASVPVLARLFKPGHKHAR